jgi:hypothetical protein
VDYSLLTFDGYHFAHIAARNEKLRLDRIAADTRRAYESNRRYGSR